MIDYLLALILVLLPSYLARFSVFGIPTTLLEVLIYFTFLVWLFSRGWRNIPRPVTLYPLPLSLFLLAGVISVYISPNHAAALGLFKAYFFDSFLMFLMVLSCKKKKILVNALILSGFLVSLHVIWQKMTGQVTIDNRVLGIFGENPNYLALYLAPIAVLVFGKLINSNIEFRNSKQIQMTKIQNSKQGFGHFNFEIRSLFRYSDFGFRILTFLTLLLALFFSGSRGGLLAVLAGVLFVLFFVSRAKIVKIAVTAIFVLAIFATGYLFRPVPNDLNRVGESSNVRVLIWQVSWEMIKEKPIFGYGLANFQPAFTRRMNDIPNFNEYISPMARYPHNLYLAFWLETGLMGLISLIGLIGLIFLVFRQNKNYVTIALVASLFTVLIYGLVDTPFFKNDLAILFWVLIALII